MTDHHVDPTELRARAKQHMHNWRSLYRDAPWAAAYEREQAENLVMLADEADEAKAKSAEMGRMGE